MTTQQLERFFRKKGEKSKASKSNPVKIREEWIRSVEDLYHEIETKLLARLINDKVFILSRRPKQLFEEALGEYSIDDLALTIGDETAILSPKGRLIVGAQGRIDLEGQRGVVTLVLNPGRWSFVTSRTPTLRLAPLNETTLLQAILEETSSISQRTGKRCATTSCRIATKLMV